MINFRTELPLNTNTVKIKHKDVIFVIGSCFSSSIGQKLLLNKFDCLVNPFGTLYHPIPILKNLQALLNDSPFQEDDFTQIEERHVHFGMHSEISAKNRGDLKDTINKNRRAAKDHISRASFAFITYGTAYSHYHRKLGKIVANCHKQPSNLFEKVLSSVDELVTVIQETQLSLKELNPEIQVIMTVSPVRHKRLGFIENNRSKAHLLSAIHTAAENTSHMSYFPSYELVMDDLRDYRFYEGDLVHPNKHAINYIWSYFNKTYFDSATIELNKKINSVSKFLNHKPFDPESSQYKKKLLELVSAIEVLESEHQIDFQSEREVIARKNN